MKTYTLRFEFKNGTGKIQEYKIVTELIKKPIAGNAFKLGTVEDGDGASVQLALNKKYHELYPMAEKIFEFYYNELDDVQKSNRLKSIDQFIRKLKDKVFYLLCVRDDNWVLIKDEYIFI